MHTAQKGADGAKLLRRAKAAGGDSLALLMLDDLQRLPGLVGRGLQRGAQAVGGELARQQVVEGDAPRRQTAARQPGDEAGEAAARAVAQAQDVDGGLDRAGGDVDDAPEAARRHAVHGRLDEFDGGEHVAVQRAQPGVAAPLAEIARRRPAGVGDQDVDVPPRTAGHREQRGPPGLGRHVGRDGEDLVARAGGPFGAQPRGPRLQRLGAACGHHHVDPFQRQRPRATPAQPLAGAAHDRPAACDAQIHRLLLINPGQPVNGPAG